MAENVQFVGVREISQHFSEYLDRVERGATYVVTRRGSPAAVLRAAKLPDLPAEAFTSLDDSHEDWGA